MSKRFFKEVESGRYKAESQVIVWLILYFKGNG